MIRASDINNRIEGHMILFNVEVSTDGIILPFDEHMNINQSQYKRFGFRKIKCVISDNHGYPIWICITYYNRVNGASYINIRNIHINLTKDISTDIGSKIISHLNRYKESKGIYHRFRTSMRYDYAIYID
jgi:hypothetical protein